MTKLFGIFSALMVGLFSASADSSASVYKDADCTEFFRRTNGMVAGDGGISIPLSDGAVLWLFGDSHIDDFDPASGTIPCLFQVRNVALLQQTNDPGRVVTLISRHPTDSLFRIKSTERLWYWPLAGVQLRDTVYIYVTKFRSAGTGGVFDFKAISRHWAKIKRSDLAQALAGGTNSIPISYSSLPDFKGIEFGCGFSEETDGYTYAYGAKGTKTGGDIYVARFLSKKPEGRWTYWDGNQWVKGVTKAAVIGHGATASMCIAKIKDQWVSVSSAFSIACDQGKDIYAATSANLTGPFSPIKKIYTIDDTYQGHYPFFYLPMLHPEFVNAKNEILLTYSINGYDPCVPTCQNGRMNPDHYRVKAIRVPLELLGVR